MRAGFLTDGEAGAERTGQPGARPPGCRVGADGEGETEGKENTLCLHFSI